MYIFKILSKIFSLSLRLGHWSSWSRGCRLVTARAVSRARSRSELTARENFSPDSLCPTWSLSNIIYIIKVLGCLYVSWIVLVCHTSGQDVLKQFLLIVLLSKQNQLTPTSIDHQSKPNGNITQRREDSIEVINVSPQTCAACSRPLGVRGVSRFPSSVHLGAVRPVGVARLCCASPCLTQTRLNLMSSLSLLT